MRKVGEHLDLDLAVALIGRQGSLPPSDRALQGFPGLLGAGTLGKPPPYPVLQCLDLEWGGRRYFPHQAWSA